tara:strand:+ start:219 stop:974 length:756 start_codon:yes stop_codon:yes gene_type:complete
MNSIEKVNKTRYSLKEMLKDEWDTSTIADLSQQEVEKMFMTPLAKNSQLNPLGNSAGCNFTINHRYIPSFKLHIVYYNLPEVGSNSSKVTKSICDKILNLYKKEYFNFEDSVFVIINDQISETLQHSFNNLNIVLQNDFEETPLSETIINEMEKNNYPLQNKHFRNVNVFTINNITNNIMEHRLVPKHRVIRNKNEISEILEKCNCLINQLPIILKNDIMSKILRISSGDICEIIRKSQKCGEYPFYRVCK